MNGNYSSSPTKESATGRPDRDPLATQDDPAKFLTQDSRTTGDGSARSIVEVLAEELGPSLRWATATTTRATKSAGEERFGSSLSASADP
jgi:hypothetical protein